MATIRRVLLKDALIILLLFSLTAAQDVKNQDDDSFKPRQRDGFRNRGVEKMDGGKGIHRENKDDLFGKQRHGRANLKDKYDTMNKINPNVKADSLNRPPINQGEVFHQSDKQLINQEDRRQFETGRVGQIPPIHAIAPKSKLPAAGLPRKAPPIKIAEQAACANDVRSLCSASSMSNNFAVLDCLQNDVNVSMIKNSWPEFINAKCDCSVDYFLTKTIKVTCGLHAQCQCSQLSVATE